MSCVTAERDATRKPFRGFADMDRFTKWVLGVVGAALVAAGGEFFSWRMRIDARLAAIEATRFTERDAREMESRLEKHVDAAVARDGSWLREDLGEIKATLRSVDVRLRELERAAGEHP